MKISKEEFQRVEERAELDSDIESEIPVTWASNVNHKNCLLFLLHPHNILLLSYYNMLELYHLESEINSDKEYQKEMEEPISDLNIKTQAWLIKLKDQSGKPEVGSVF